MNCEKWFPGGLSVYVHLLGHSAKAVKASSRADYNESRLNNVPHRPFSTELLSNNMNLMLFLQCYELRVPKDSAKIQRNGMDIRCNNWS
jgi:hypothetical protein